jgi:activating signal cointegrator 1
MKALTLTQPWATLIAIGAKRIETRCWRTPYRGTLAIHAAKGFPKSARETCNDPAFAAELGPDVLPVGAVIATCRLISCLPTRELQSNRLIEVDPTVGCDDFLLDDRERQFGDYSPGRWAWLLADVRRCNPIPRKRCSWTVGMGNAGTTSAMARCKVKQCREAYERIRRAT